MVKFIKDDRFYFSIGILGSLILLYGLTQDISQPYFVIGGFLLLTTAVHFKLFYFMALETILIAGHGTIFLGIGRTLQFILPILLTLQLLFYYVFSGQLKNIYIFLGILGISLLSIGFSYENQWVFFLGSSFIAIYAFYYTKEKKAAFIWAVLNSLFALIAITKLIIA
ncbi:MAG: hypothetical protein LCH30_07630 [Proteobacteria bacterium]|nr:hypothetical protein [Pseudomonadota bacterium]